MSICMNVTFLGYKIIAYIRDVKSRYETNVDLPVFIDWHLFITLLSNWTGKAPLIHILCNYNK